MPHTRDAPRRRPKCSLGLVSRPVTWSARPCCKTETKRVTSDLQGTRSSNPSNKGRRPLNNGKFNVFREVIGQGVAHGCGHSFVFLPLFVYPVHSHSGHHYLPSNSVRGLAPVSVSHLHCLSFPLRSCCGARIGRFAHVSRVLARFARSSAKLLRVTLVRSPPLLYIYNRQQID
jgi:hypothetical protein